MLTARAAARLLAAADSLVHLRPLAGALGFPTDGDALSRTTLAALGLTTLARSATLYAVGGRRLLALHARDDADGADRPDGPDGPDGADATDDAPPTDHRTTLRRVAAALLRHAPAPYWSVALLSADTRGLSLAAIAPAAHHPRIAALHVQRDRVLDSDADTLRALATIDEPDDLLHHARCLDILARDAVCSRFVRALDGAIDTLARSLAPATPGAQRTGSSLRPTAGERRELALLTASRTLFLAFLEAKGWLDGRRDFLLHHTLDTLARGGRLHHRLLRPLCFGTLNTRRRHRAPAARAFGAVPFLNGGLFTPTALERRFRHWHFSDDALTHLVADVLDRHRFTVREDTATYSEAAVDPEMLGRAFESLMAPADRHRSGSYYTPPHLVATAVDAALQHALPAHLTDAPRRAAILALRILDPACGSGAFLVHTLETLDAQLHAAGDTRPTHLRRRDLLATTLFGVDREPLAVWLCELRLWLSVIIDCTETDVTRVPPLPNLDHHIRVGDSLAGGTFDFAPPDHTHLATLRTRYARATGVRKRRLATHLAREERRRTVDEVDRRHRALHTERRELLSALRHRDLFGQRVPPAHASRTRLATLRRDARDLAAHRARIARGGALPFRFAALFADVAAYRGFSVIIGNPPWVRPHALPALERQRLRHEFRAMRFATWRAGAARAGAGTGFATQPDLAVAFVERSVALLRPTGTLALLVPAKLWRTLSGGGVRRLLLHDTTLHALHDWSDAPAQFDAATYPSLIVATRTPPPTETETEGTPPDTPLDIVLHRAHTTPPLRFRTTADALPLGGDPGAPWLLLTPTAREAFERLRHAGPPLAHSALSRPTLGVKCGCNAAFLVELQREHEADADDAARIASQALPTSDSISARRNADRTSARTGTVERHLLRPALRGEALARARRAADASPTHTRSSDTLRILWTHDRDDRPLPALPPGAARWLAPWRTRLNARRDTRKRHPWWTLFRTDAARSELPRVVWADLARQLAPLVLDAGDPTVPLNTCYVVRTASLAQAHALAALLHSRIANRWLDALAEPARGGYRRFLGWTVSSLPIPADWEHAERLLAPLGRRLARGITPPDLDQVVADAYGLTLASLAPLLEPELP
ncbi:MAG: SAM-dependent methyltransferase [Gemmatimonadetes bacterium]|nr:SAM-dependent methyltransferase [Gemmatimonadota bacterium]